MSHIYQSILTYLTTSTFLKVIRQNSGMVLSILYGVPDWDDITERGSFANTFSFETCLTVLCTKDTFVTFAIFLWQVSHMHFIKRGLALACYFSFLLRSLQIIRWFSSYEVDTSVVLSRTRVSWRQLLESLVSSFCLFYNSFIHLLVITNPESLNCVTASFI